jgi:MoaA/NifB/PqqE/SkfB family radical SAM enzyme
MSYRRFINKVVNNAEFRLGRTHLLSYPQLAFIESTNICNLRCPLCPTGAGKLPHEKGKMRLDLFKKIIDQIGPVLYEVQLMGFGEPLLNEEIFDIVRYAKRHPMKVRFNSNLTVFDREMARELVKSGLDNMTVSIDGVTQEVYEKYRVGGDLEKVLENLKLLLEVKKDLSRPNPEIRWQFMVTKVNEHEIDAARTMAEELGVKFHARRVRFDLDVFSKMKEEDATKRWESDWNPEDTRYSRYRGGKEKKKNPRRCAYLWKTIDIKWDGSIAPCCNIIDQKDFVRRSFPDNFRVVWNGPEFVAARELFYTGMNERAPEACRRCMALGAV